MTFTKLVREFCLNNDGTIIDVSDIKNNEFSDIPYKTLLKIFNRLEEENIVRRISKGVYSIGKYDTVNEADIVTQYTSDNKGMIVGYHLYNELGLTSFHDVTIKIYTNAMSTSGKNIGRFHLIKTDLDFDGKTVDMISLLEIITAGYGVVDCNILRYDFVVNALLSGYNDEVFAKIIEVIQYPYSTITTLSKRLFDKRIINKCLEIYANDGKEY